MVPGQNRGIPTQFAPAERASKLKLEKQIALFNKNDLMNHILNSVPLNVTVLNSNRQIVYSNDNFSEYLGIEKKDLVYGSRVGEAVNCIHAKESEGGCGTTEFCSTCGAVHAIINSLNGKESAKECRITVQHGDAIDLMVWGKPIKVEGDNFSIFSFIDIGDAKRRHALERIFFHDVLNTAGSLRSFLELSNDPDYSEDREEFIKYAYEISGNLVEEILEQKDLVAAENGELAVNYTDVDSIELMEIVKRQFSTSDKFKHCSIIISPESKSIKIVTDKVLLRRVIANLVKNAVEASNEGDEITISCTDQNEYVIFSVHNKSVMPKNVKLQIFQRSFSTKGKGRGLGTYSIKLLTERYLNGEVTFTSEMGKGTTFYVKLPKNPENKELLN